MGRLKTILTLFSMALCSSGWSADCMAQSPVSDSISGDSLCREQMRAEADAFLRRLPADLQHRQTLAIQTAIAGDCSSLQSVRHSRNTPPAYSANVRVRSLTPRLRLYEPAGSGGRRLPLLVHFHGGGWTFGSLNSCARFCDAMAAAGNVKVLAVDYRLAPEHPFPQGLEDCRAAVCYARAHADALGIDSLQIFGGGDSAGGNLAVAVAMSPECRGALAGLLLFYPVTKAFDDHSASWQAYGKGFALDAELMDAFNAAYAGTAPSHRPLIDVGLADESSLAALPPTLLIAAGRDILCDQGKEFAGRAGEKIERIEFPGAVHLFITVPGQDTAFRKAVSLSTSYIAEHLN